MNLLRTLPAASLRTRPRSLTLARAAKASLPRAPLSTSRPGASNRQPIDNPEFVSILDAPPQIVRAGRRHGPGIILLGSSNGPTLAFVLC